MKQMELEGKPELAESFLENIDDKYLEEAMKGKRTWSRAAKIAASMAAVVVLAFSSLTAATAAGSLTAYEYLYKLNPYLAEKMTPVMKSCIDQGIEMKVVGIYVHDTIADIYVSMQDLEEDRIDGTADLFDSYSIHTNCDQWGGCTLVDYDEETHAATFLIKVGLYDQKIDGRKMTFSVSRFLSGKQETWKELPEIDLAKVVSEEADYRPEVEVLNLLESRRDRGYSEYTTGLPKLLVPNETQTFSPVVGAKITAYGIVDGKLHVQVYYEDVHGRDDHGDIQLLDANGMNVLRSGDACFWDKDRKGRYEEYEFDVPMDDLSEYTVIGYFSTGAKLYQGNWKITFPFTNIEEMGEPLTEE